MNRSSFAFVERPTTTGAEMKTLRAMAVCLLASSALCLPGRVAHAQMDSREAIDLQNQIAELRQELQMMQSAQQTGGQAPQAYVPPPAASYGPPPAASGGGSDTAAELVVRVSGLEEQVRTLQGKVDDLTNQLQRQHDELAKQIGDLEFKLGQGGAESSPPTGDGGGSPLGGPPPPPVPQPQPAMPAHRTAEMALRDGNNAYARHDYAAAAAAAREVLESGHGPRLTDAQLLLARAEGAQGQFKDSAADYYKAYSHAPRSPTAPVALLGVANSLIALNDKNDACQALAKLGAEFPVLSGVVKQNAIAARKRAGCGR
jgi:TolA-binding protein